MSNSPDNGLDLEELELQLLPAWAKQSPDTNRYAKYEGSAADSGPPGREHRERRGRRVERSAHRQRDETDQDRPRKPREGRFGHTFGSVVHAAIMAVQAVTDHEQLAHLWGDVPALFLVATVLAALMPRGEERSSTRHAVA